MSPETFERLASALAQVPGLLCAWLFGSSARGQASPDSDVDVAILFRDPPGFEAVGSALAACQDTLRRDDVDVVVLNTASTILAFEALSGRRLFTFAPQETAAFESLVAREYEDESARLTRASAYPGVTESPPAT